MKRIWIVLGIILGVIVIGVAGYLGFRSSKPKVQTTPQVPETVTVNRCDVEQSVTAPGSVVNFQEINIEMPVDGRLAKILFQPGDTVRAGDILATLQSDPVQLAQAQVTQAEAQKKLNDARSVQKNAQSTLNLALTDTDSSAAYISLVQDNLAVADANLALVQANLEKAQADLGILTAGAIIAPSDGVILKSNAEIQKSIPAGTSLFTIHNSGDIEVQTTVVEEDFPYVAVGQKVELYFDALPDMEASGVVSRILPKRVSSDRPLYYMFIRLDKVPEHLVDGMTADAAVLIAQRQQVLCLPRALVHASSGNTATVKIWNGITTEERQIEIGLRGDVYLEILSGLKEGEKVVTR
jgi:RND family efflux transporter MFP subunit